ncbi:MAG: PHP domain-containing protein [Streptosporangiales bacterium]
MRPAAGPPALDEDHHVHSTFSDDAVATLADNVRAARQRGLRVLCLADHVRASTPWVAEFAATVAALRPGSGLVLLAGVEAKILDVTGRLDLPGDLHGVDRVLIADHQFPGEHGPVSPGQVRAELASGQRSAAEVIDCLLTATTAALSLVAMPQLAHLFSLLPKLGLDEADVPDPALRCLAAACCRAGARVEVNEKWGCPSPRTLRACAAAGVPLVASTDSHDCATVGAYPRVRGLLGRTFAGAVP